MRPSYQLIERPQYLERLKNLTHTQLIKVVTGVRRCGKSTLLRMYQQELKKDGVASQQILSINFEDMNVSHLLDPEVLHAHILERLIPEKMNYIFLNEVQHVNDFQRVVNSLYTRENIDPYITGSNAQLLSGELATLLSGRYIELHMFPLSFKEYLSASAHDHLQKAYNDYLQFSSFPYALEFSDNMTVLLDYLQGIYSTVVLKDVIGRNQISDSMKLESVIQFLFDAIGNLLSTKKIADTLTSEGRKITSHTVENYVSSLLQSYIFYRANRFDVKGKQHLKTLEKYYCVDIGLRNLVLGRRPGDTGHILENVIYLELLRRSQHVYIGKVGKQEVDFITRSKEGLRYYQVAATVRDSETLKRELAPLLSIDDHYPKYLLTLDEDPTFDYEGIICMNALEFLVS